MLRRRLDSSGVEAGGESGGEQKLTRKWGGCQHTERGGCQQTPFHFPPSPFGFVVLDRTTRTAPAERERTGATPPFSPLARFGVGGGCQPRRQRQCQHAPPPSGGSLPSSCIPAGRLPGPRAGRTTRRTERRDA